MTRIPLWLKLAYTAYAAVLLPAYALKADAGPLNFLWFSDIALFSTGAALWLENSLLASTTAVGVLGPELFWNLCFFTTLVTGKSLSSFTDYMFDRRRPRFMRGIVADQPRFTQARRARAPNISKRRATQAF